MAAESPPAECGQSSNGELHRGIADRRARMHGAKIRQGNTKHSKRVQSYPRRAADNHTMSVANPRVSRIP
jgi:hypothetical protein